MIIGLSMLLATPVLAVYWLTGAAEDAASQANKRKHFSRPSFSMWADKDGIHVKEGRNPDHATRCQESLADWYKTKQRMKWYPWIWLLVMIIALQTTTTAFLIICAECVLFYIMYRCIKRVIWLLRVGPKGLRRHLDEKYGND